MDCEGTCTCDNGMCDSGPNGEGTCLVCQPGYFGSNCQALCSCLHGVCNDGEPVGIACAYVWVHVCGWGWLCVAVKEATVYVCMNVLRLLSAVAVCCPCRAGWQWNMCYL